VKCRTLNRNSSLTEGTIEMRNAAVLALSICLAGILSGCAQLADPFTMTLNLPAEYCFDVGTSNDTDWSGEETVSTRDLVDDIDEDLIDNIEATRVADIRIAATGPYPSADGAQVSGSAQYRLGNTGPWAQLVAFHDIRYSELGEGISVLHPDATRVTFDDAGVDALILALASSTGLPELVLNVKASGTTTPVTDSGVSICFSVVLQTDAEFSP
jgi:hypothetical protein